MKKRKEDNDTVNMLNDFLEGAGLKRFDPMDDIKHNARRTVLKQTLNLKVQNDRL